MSTVEIILRDPPLVPSKKSQGHKLNLEWWETPAGGTRGKVKNMTVVLTLTARAAQINVVTPHVDNNCVNPVKDCGGKCFMCQLAEMIENLSLTASKLRRFALTMPVTEKNCAGNGGNHHLKLLSALGRFPVPLVVAFPQITSNWCETFERIGRIRALYLRLAPRLSSWNDEQLRDATVYATQHLSSTWLTDFSLGNDPWSSGHYTIWSPTDHTQWKNLSRQPIDKVIWMRHFLATGGNALAGRVDYLEGPSCAAPLAYALRVQRARISNMHDIFTLIMCAQRRGNHPLFCRTNRDVLRKIFSFLRPELDGCPRRRTRSEKTTTQKTILCFGTDESHMGSHSHQRL
jgi:hypothetical protein